MKKSLIILFTAFLAVFIPWTVLAQHTEHVEGQLLYEFPRIDPVLALTGGYRYIKTNKSDNIPRLEFDLVEDSVIIGVDSSFFRYPDRFTLNFFYEDRKDYFLDVGYGYRDLILARWINSTIFHNTDNIRYLNETAIDQRDSDANRYGLKTGINDILFRLKYPGYAAHLYFEGSMVAKEGTIQQRSLGGAAHFANRIKTTQARDIDWETNRFTFGLNSHLGHVEADYAFSLKTFDVTGGERVLEDSFTAGGGRPAGDYLHHQLSETNGMTHTLKFHTAYTGKIVGAAAVSFTQRDNDDSDAEANIIRANAAITMMPRTNITFFLKYRHQTRDVDNPDTFTLVDQSGVNPDSVLSVRNSISSKTDHVSLKARYRVLPDLTLRGGYTFDYHRRGNAEEWHIVESTKKHKVSISADTRPYKGLKLKAGYSFRKNSDPAYNTEPDDAHEGTVSAFWIPTPRVSLWARYSIAMEDREHLHYVDSTGASVSTEDREKMSDNAMGTITFLVVKNLSVSGYYTYMHNRIEEDIIANPSTGPPTVLTDVDSPYTDVVNSFGGRISYRARHDLEFEVAASHTVATSGFQVSIAEATQPDTIAQFSRLKTRETTVSTSGRLDLMEGLKLSVQYLFSIYDDIHQTQADADGNAHVVMATLSKTL